MSRDRDRPGAFNGHSEPLDPAWWDPMAVVEAEVYEDVRAQAWDLHQAEQASVTFADRIQNRSRLVLSDGTRLEIDDVIDRLQGAVVVVTAGRTCLVFLRAIAEAENLDRTFHADPPPHASVGSWLRSHVGSMVRVDLAGRPTGHGLLTLAAADHVDLRDDHGSTRSIAIHATLCVWLISG